MSLGSRFLLDCGGSAYLAWPMVEEDIRAGRLYQVKEASTIDRIGHVVYQLNSRRGGVVEKVLDCFSR